VNYPKEPWKALHPKDGFDNGLVDADGMHISLRGDAMDRIVACVNACADIESHLLEQFPRGINGMSAIAISKQRDDIKAQRDELLAALKEAEKTLAHCKADIGYRHRQTEAAIMINRVIAKCEAQS
jgi:hypothetical protein